MSKKSLLPIFNGIDLSSDTATRPTVAMKKAMMNASLGDEQKGEDPTTRQLEEMTAKLLGLDAALFLPSATMANEIAICLLCEPGDELIAAEQSHLFLAEGGGPAVHAQVLARSIPTKTGLFTGEDLQTVYHWVRSPRHPLSTCVSVENTTNMGGGLAWDLKTLRSVISIGKKLKLKMHLDGARLFNAAVKTKLKPHQLSSQFDTVTICLSKGLGCPMGALLAFRKSYYEKALRLKHLFGGALRQSGIVAAAGIYALQHHISRLKEDHEHAALFSKRLSEEITEIAVETHLLSTNMVFFKWQGKNMTPTQFHNACIKRGVRFSQVGNNRFRAVTHLDISSKDIHTTILALKETISKC